MHNGLWKLLSTFVIDWYATLARIWNGSNKKAIKHIFNAGERETHRNVIKLMLLY